MEPRLAFVSAGVCGRGALRGLRTQVPRWSPWKGAWQHSSTGCERIDARGGVSVGAWVPSLRWAVFTRTLKRTHTHTHTWPTGGITAGPLLLLQPPSHSHISPFSRILQSLTMKEANLSIVTFYFILFIFFFFYVFAFTVQICKQLSVKTFQLVWALSGWSFLWNSDFGWQESRRELKSQTGEKACLILQESSMTVAHIVYPLIFIILWNKVDVIVVRLACGLEARLFKSVSLRYWWNRCITLLAK